SRRTNEKLRISDKRFRCVFEASQIGMVVIDPVTRTIESVNPTFCAISGLAEEELIGRNPRTLMDQGASAVIETPEMAQLMSGELASLRKSAVMARPGGEKVFVDIVALVVDDADGNKRLVGTIADRT